jgi:diguanylate cyclase (GGDEF)-like protein
MMSDIDRVKKVNDEFGHEAGDVVLQHVAAVLRANTRLGEDVARIGGAEFLVICPHTTQEKAAKVAERLRAAVESHLVHSSKFKGSVTVSVGVAERTHAIAGVDALLRAADDAVYTAKANGRNRIELARPPQGEALTA